MISVIKNSLVLLLIGLGCFRCQKTGSSSGQPNIQYLADAQSIRIAGGLDTAHRYIPYGTFYGCYATKPGGADYYVINGNNDSTGLMISVLTSGKFTLDSTYATGNVSPSFRINNSIFGINPGDWINLRISRFSNGTMDGTFEAALSTAEGKKVSITDGRFTNIRLEPRQ